MINELGQLQGKQSLNKIAEGNMAQSSQVQSREILVTLAKIQIGDILSGKLILEDNQTMLKLEDGLKLLANVKNPILSEQLLDFLVVGKDRQHLELEQVQLNQAESKNEVYRETILKEMQLPYNTDTNDIVGQWMDKQLPFIKNQLMQVYQLAKNYGLPSEALTNISANNSGLNEQEVQLLAQFKTNGMTIINETLEDVFNALDVNEAAKLNVSLGKHLSNQVVKQILASQIVKQTIDLDNNLETKLNNQEKMRFEVLMKQFEGEELSDLKNVLESLPKETLKVIAERLIHKHVIIEQKDVLDKPEEMLKLDETASRLKEIVKDLQNHIGENNVKQSLQTLDQIANVLDKYNAQGQYYCFPLQINEQQASGELYFFKPKKAKKESKNEQGMYIVLALDMPSLKHIEIHLVEKTEELELKIKVENDEILRQMERNEHQLRALMNETMMPIGGIKMERIETNIDKKSPKRTEVLSRLDFRI